MTHDPEVIEMLARELGRSGNVWGFTPHDAEWKSTYRAQAAALYNAIAPRIAAQAVRVKPLVWEEVHEQRSDEDPRSDFIGAYTADSPFGQYVIDVGWGSDCYYWSVQSPDGSDIGSDFDDPTYAKAAAQADYEARILAAVETVDLAATVAQAVAAERAACTEELRLAVAAAVEWERERCAKMCDRIAGNTKDFDAWTRRAAGACSAAIRAPEYRRASLTDIRAAADAGALHHNAAAPEGDDLGAEFWAGAKVEVRG